MKQILGAQCSNGTSIWQLITTDYEQSSSTSPITETSNSSNGTTTTTLTTITESSALRISDNSKISTILIILIHSLLIILSFKV